MKKVLVIDDNADFRDLCGKAIELSSCDPVLFADASDALSWLKSTASLPCLLFIDFTMPGMPASEFIVHLRNDPKLAHLKVVLLSGWGNLADKTREIGADASLQKPFQLEAFEKFVGEHCG